MKQYAREDGFQCLAVKFEGLEAQEGKTLFEAANELNMVGLEAVWVAEETTDEWEEFEDEDGDMDVRQIVIPEHIYLAASKDKLFVGDYVVKRDGETYIQDGATFEAIWSESITDDVEEWHWDLTARRAYSKRPGIWIHKRDPDVLSLDGGVSYYRESERPIYAAYGQLYQSAPKILG